MARPSRSGCSSANHGSAGPRDAMIAATGSVNRAVGTLTLTSTVTPRLRARRTPARR